MYSCFIEECPHKSYTSEERKDHCIKFHKFPSNYRFDTCLSGSSHNLKKTDHDNSKMDIVNDDKDNNDCSENNKIVNEKKILKNFSFGHSKMKTFDMKNLKKSNKKHEKFRVSALENDETFTDLKESLPNN